MSEYCKRPSSKDGLTCNCRKCFKKYRQNNKESIAETKRQHFQDNKGYVTEQHRQYNQRLPAGVYGIENKVTGKIYIGQSTHYQQRWNAHNSLLSRGVHDNLLLQADYDKYGKDVFDYRVVQEYPCNTSSDVLLVHEQRVIDKYISEGKEVYNMTNPSLITKHIRD